MRRQPFRQHLQRSLILLTLATNLLVFLAWLLLLTWRSSSRWLVTATRFSSDWHSWCHYTFVFCVFRENSFPGWEHAHHLIVIYDLVANIDIVTLTFCALLISLIHDATWFFNQCLIIVVWVIASRTNTLFVLSPKFILGEALILAEGAFAAGVCAALDDIFSNHRLLLGWLEIFFSFLST